MAFCNYCQCSDCQHGDPRHKLTHAKTIKGDWICDVCWLYNSCKGPDGRDNPCKDKNCKHRPKLTTAWTNK